MTLILTRARNRSRNSGFQPDPSRGHPCARICRLEARTTNQAGCLSYLATPARNRPTDYCA